MPTYEYQCSACGHAFERFQAITAQPIRKCPQCGKRRVQRLISGGAGLIFKGNGFYITDYRSEGYKKAASSESSPSSSSSASSAKDQASADSKSATGKVSKAGASKKADAAKTS